MTTTLSAVTPVFGIILMGFLAARLRLLPETTGKGLSDFVFSVAMPALLFHTMAVAEAPGAAPGALIAGYFGANFLTWIIASFVTTRVLQRPLADAPAFSMAACFGNTVMLGLPLGSATFGPSVTAAMAVILAVHAPVLWCVATLQQTAIERGTAGEVRQRFRAR